MSKRNVTLDIWRAVVVAGAMIGAPGCGSKQAAPTTPPVTEEGTTTEEATPPDGEEATPPDGEANPCGEENPCGEARPRTDEEEEPRGRGFILG